MERSKGQPIVKWCKDNKEHQKELDAITFEIYKIHQGVYIK